MDSFWPKSTLIFIRAKCLMSLQNPHDEMTLEDPIELVSRLVVAQDWFLKQTSAHGLLADVPGRWGHYQLLADWHADTEVLNIEARLDVLIEREDEMAVQRLLAELNTELYLGISSFRLIAGILFWMPATVAQGGRGDPRTD